VASKHDSDPSARRPAHPLAKQPAPGRNGRRKGPRPLPQGEQFFTPGATGLRRAVERRSATLLVFLYQLPRWILPIVMVALLLAVLPVLAFILWLAYLSWPSLGTVARLMRVALGAFVTLLALDRFGLF